MTKRRSTPFIIAGLIAALILPMGTLAGSASAPTLSLPASMAAVGDSITQAASTGGSLGTDYPQNSWATGTNTTVNSHYLRLIGAGASISSSTFNLSVSGAKVANLNAQMQNAVTQHPDYLTVQIGGNDLCTDTFAGMTSVGDFESQFRTAMTTLTSGSPGTHVYVVSIPDAYQLWSLFHNNFWARFIWSVGGVCQSLLANPTSTQAADVQRRAAVQQRNIDYNTKLAIVCGEFSSRCLFDNSAVFAIKFASGDVAGDYFHPSIAGQAKLASVTWGAGYNWTAGTPTNTPPAASFTSSCTDLTCTFIDTSTDSDGTIASRSWTFGDSGTSTATNPSHTYATGGTYTVGLTVTDNGGVTGSTSASISVSAPPATQYMWIGSSSGTSAPAGSRWTATVTIVVTGSPPGPGAGVTITGSWSGTGGSTTCTTDTWASCAFTSSKISASKTSVSFAVTSMSKVGWTYQPTSNALSGAIVTVTKS